MTRDEEIQIEAANCRKAFEGIKVGHLVSHYRHGQWLKELTEPYENRIQFILANKPRAEQAERLRRFRPFAWKKAIAGWEKANAAWKKAIAGWKKANAAWKKAIAGWKKANAAWKKAIAGWKKANAAWEKADAAWEKAIAGWKKAIAAREKAIAAREKAIAGWKKAIAAREKADAAPAMLRVHAEVCGCPWDATHDIFGVAR